MSSTSIKKNYMYNMIYQALIMILPLITAPYLARVVGAEGTGIYSYSYSIAQYFVYFSMLGISNLGNRSIAKIRENRNERNKVFSDIYTLQLCTCSIFSVGYIVFCLLFMQQNTNIALLQIFYVLSAFLDISWFYFGMENFKITVVRQIFIKIFTTICIFLFVKTSDDLWKYTLILSLSTLIGQSILFISLKKYVKYIKVNIKDIKKYIKPALILFIPIIATSIYRVMDKIMIGYLSNMNQVGYYENSDKLITTCLGIVGALGSVMLPRMTNLVANGEVKKEKEYLIKSIEATMFLACAISMGIAAVAKEFIPIFYGNQFLECIDITQMLTISALFISWANVVRMQYLIPNEKDKIYVISILCGAIINLIINYTLIPRYGAKGAAWATIIAEAIVMIIQTICSYKGIPIKKFIKKTIPFIIIGLFMYICVRKISTILHGGISGLLIEILIGGAIYLGLSIIYFVYTKNEIIIRIKDKFTRRII